MQACTIKLFINKNLKLRKRKGKRETGYVINVYKYQQKAPKALVVSKPIITWQNLAECYITLSPLSSTTTFHHFPPVLFSIVFHLCRFPPFSTCAVTLPPLSVKPALRLCSLYYAYGVFLSLCSFGSLSSSLCQHSIHLSRYFGSPGLLG